MDLDWIKTRILPHLDEKEKEENCEVKEHKDKEENEIKTEELTVKKLVVPCLNCKGTGDCLNGKPIVYAFPGYRLIYHLYIYFPFIKVVPACVLYHYCVH